MNRKLVREAVLRNLEKSCEAASLALSEIVRKREKESGCGYRRGRVRRLPSQSHRL